MANELNDIKVVLTASGKGKWKWEAQHSQAKDGVVAKSDREYDSADDALKAAAEHNSIAGRRFWGVADKQTLLDNGVSVEGGALQITDNIGDNANS